MENITTIIISLTALVTAIGGLAVAIKKTKKEIEETLPQKIKRQCDIDLEIVKRMEQIKEFLKADRVQIYDFHNGYHYANGRSALKTSCTYEVCRASCRAYQMYLQAIPLTCLPNFVQTLLDDKEIKVNNIEEIRDTMPASYSFKKDQGIKSFYDIILQNKNQEPIGFLAVQFKETDKVNFDEQAKNEILKLKFFIEENLEKMTLAKK